MENTLLYPNARKYFADQLWAIRPETLDVMCDIISMRARGVTLSKEEIAARIGAAKPMQSAVAGSIAIIPLCGVIDQKVDSMTLISGGTSVNGFMDAFRSAIADKSVTAIILDVDSPGGSISGIPEAANEIYNSRGKKHIIAVADPMIASAAYWLSAAADEIVCMPSGWVGSIGVIRAHDDWSKAEEAAGYKVTYITYGQYKSEGNSDNPLPDEAQKYYQSQVDSIGNMFTAFIAKARKVPVDTVRAEFGQGRMLLAKEALAAKMIDGIGTMEQTIMRLSKPSAMTTQSFSTSLKVKDATKEVLVGLSGVVDLWAGLVDRRLAQAKKPEEILSKAKADALVSFHAALRESQATCEELMARAGIVQPIQAQTEEPIVESIEEIISESTITDAQKAIAEFETIRARSLGVHIPI